MANIGNIVAAGVSARNENTLALANLNFDFSLVKIGAPKEFLNIGNGLSQRRRKNAEEGSTHRTARKLGALFEQVANPPERLVKAYGQRASEISQVLEARQDGKQFGLFSDHAGADATVIWAAAVSGKTAIAVALLACMLARMWDAPKATSIWYELVEKRKEQIHQTCDGSELSHQALIAASRQEITRKELAEWDASTRSWISIADRIKETEHRKMESVLLQLSLPVDNNTDVFTSVVRVWKTAMTAMENLCNGVAQGLKDGAVLLAISSWHIYPDIVMCVERPRVIEQNDILVSPAGRLTVGLEDANPASAIGVHWSLSLANLRYYGDPVMSKSHIRDASRISFRELTLVCLGSLFAAWRGDHFDPYSDEEKGAKFIVALWESLERIPFGVSTYHAQRCANSILSDSNHWLYLLAGAARELLENNNRGCLIAHQLVSLGIRQGQSLLKSEITAGPPLYFGLLDIRVWLQFALHSSPVKLLREFARMSKVDETKDKAIIHLDGAKNNFTTVFPLQPSKGLTQDEGGLREKHVRWIPDSEPSSQMPLQCEPESSEIRPFSIDHIQKCGPVVRCASSLWEFQRNNAQLDTVTEGIEVDELHCLVGNDVGGLYVLFDGINSRGKSTLKSAQKRTQKPMKISESSTYITFEDMVLLLGADLLNTGILIILKSYPFSHSDLPLLDFWKSSYRSDAQKGNLTRHKNIPSLMYNIQGPSNPRRIMKRGRRRYMPQSISHKIPGLNEPDLDERSSAEASDNSETDDTEGAMTEFWKQVNPERGRRSWLSDFARWTPTFAASMYALSGAATIWSYLPDATISLNVIKHSLFSAPWLADDVRCDRTSGRLQGSTVVDAIHTRPTISISDAFSCIVMLETDDLVIPPSELKNVFAISTRNTIYAAAALLADPYTDCPQYEMRMIYGNVGRPGVSMMIPPTSPLLREPSLESWRLINHEQFKADSQCDDMFGRTSLHLSFTGYEQPVATTVKHGARDLEACYLETVVTVFDGRERVGDLDILGAFDKTERVDEKDISDYMVGVGKINDTLVLSRMPAFPDCPHSSRPSPCPRWIVLASWEELLEMPSQGVCIVRAHGNALSRLATAVVCIQKRVKRCSILPPDSCYYCIEEELHDNILRGDSIVLIC
ncbi:hypothetical protein F5Y12DRAFT_754138 [Xylaria sp. FL1777]|nr:hypothetical protein F5Y12DRAFT_754138 [Xylaria sp. FL1777]